MSAGNGEQRRGWCPTLHAPMASGDGLLLRLSPSAGRFDAGALRRLLAATPRLGNGAVELTGRGRLQFRGFDERGAHAFAAAAVDAGLAAADPAAERLRGAVVSPLAGLDPGCDPHTVTLAEALDAALVARADTLGGVPDKASLLVDGGGGLPLDGMSATVALRVRDGTWGVESGGARVEPARDRLPEAAIAALRNAAPRPGEKKSFRPVPAPVAVGPLVAGAFGIGVPAGSLDRRGLERLVEAAMAAGHRALRPTPWRSIVLAGLPPAEARALAEQLPGTVIDPADPRLRVAGCVGAPRCGTGLMPAAAVAPRLAASLPAGATLHVSGCAKGCAHPGSATLTLVGGPDGYDAVWHGRAGDAPRERGLDVRAALKLVGRAA